MNDGPFYSISETAKILKISEVMVSPTNSMPASKVKENMPKSGFTVRPVPATMQCCSPTELIAP
jgi:predicted CoA-binding protein